MARINFTINFCKITAIITFTACAMRILEIL